jgi:hypothetical protein
MAEWLQAAFAARGLQGQRAIRPRRELKLRRKLLRLECLGDSIIIPWRYRTGERTRARRAEYDATTAADASAATPCFQ